MTTRSELAALAERLKERRKLKYIASCKCGNCQIVGHDDLWFAGELLGMLAAHPQALVQQLTQDPAVPDAALEAK